MPKANLDEHGSNDHKEQSMPAEPSTDSRRRVAGLHGEGLLAGQLPELQGDVRCLLPSDAVPLRWQPFRTYAHQRWLRHGSVWHGSLA